MTDNETATIWSEEA